MGHRKRDFRNNIPELGEVGEQREHGFTEPSRLLYLLQLLLPLFL